MIAMPRRRQRRHRGQSVVEFALVAPLLFLMLFGILEFGWLLFTYSQVSNAAKLSARFASVHGARSAGIVNLSSPAARAYRLDPAVVEDYVRDRVNLANANALEVSLSMPDGDLVPGHRVTIDVSYPYHPMLGFIIPTPQLDLSASSTMIVHY